MKKLLLLPAAWLLMALPGVAQTSADSLALVSASWQEVHLAEGLTARKAAFEMLYGAPQEVSVIEVSPKHFRLNVQEHEGMERTGDVARRAGATAAMNGTFYNMKHGFSVAYLQLDGTVIDTTSVGPTQSNGALVIKRGKVDIIPWDKQAELKRMKRPGRASVMASGPLMLQDGKPCDLSMCNRAFVENRHPRSALVLTDEGKVLLIVVDGRRKGRCEGVSIAALAHLSSVLGGVEALNLDGGGSSTLWSKLLPADGLLNTPSDKSGERRVANSLGVYPR